MALIREKDQFCVYRGEAPSPFFVTIASRKNCMNNLNSTLSNDFVRYYERASHKIHVLVAPFSDQQLWSRPYPYGNSMGHLILHLIGNLSYYIGTEVAGTGYVRNRPQEFADTARYSKSELLNRLDAVIAMVSATLQKQSEADW